MPIIKKPGDTKIYEKEVQTGDLAAFHNQIVHKVYSTFALARDMEWASRLFVLEMINEDEEGIGSELQVKHLRPAFLGQKILIEAVIKDFHNKTLDCDITVKCGDKIIATGFTQQKILKKDKLLKIINENI
jgi:fluoroacetyl-CoA thioesterase